MANIDTPTAVTAGDEIRPIFDAVEGLLGYVPKPTQLLGTSPALLKNWWDYTKHFYQHPVFSKELLNHIRLLVAVQGEFPFCTEFNTGLLKAKTGMSDDEVVELMRDPSVARLPDNERALLQFVLRVVNEPETIGADDVQALRDIGWTDELIFEASYYGGWMLLLGLLFNAFDMHEE